METKVSELGFNLPTIEASLSSKLDVTPTGISEWVKSMAMAKTGEVAKNLFFGLQDILQTQLSYQDLFSILEMVEPSLQRVCRGLKRHYAMQPNLLEEKQLVIVNLAQALQVNLMLGYKRVIEDVKNKLNKKNNKKIAANSILKILQYANAVLLDTYQLYAATLPDFWRELYIVYTFAAKHGLLGFYCEENSKQTIGKEFKKLFIFAATNPFQWRQAEQVLINDALSVWESFAVIREINKADLGETGIFVIDLTVDNPPAAVACKQEVLNGSCLALDLTTLAEHLLEVLLAAKKTDKSELKPYHEGKVGPSIPPNVLKMLSMQWKRPGLRRAKRVKASGAIEVTFGYEAVHYFFNGQKIFNIEKLENLLNKGDKATKTEVEGIKTKTTLEKKFYLSYECRLLDSSHKGSRILWNGKPDPEMLPGRLVAFKGRDSLSKGPWILAVVVWVKRIDRTSLHLGLKHIEGNAKAVAFRNENASSNEAIYRGFILPTKGNIEQRATAIVPTQTFSENDSLRVYRDEANSSDSIVIALQFEVDEFAEVKQFEFETANAVDIECLPLVNVAEIANNALVEQEIGKSKATVGKTGGQIVAEDDIAQSDEKNTQGLFGNKRQDKFDAIWDEL